MTSIVIAAHNEANVIGRCLDSLMDDSSLDVTVVANGCSDRTAAVAAGRGARVLETSIPSKAAALNEGDAVAQGFPRIYLDADIVVPEDGASSLVRGLDDRVLAVVPVRRLDTAGRPLLVRAYFLINALLPAYRHGLFGRGMIALSERGRERFEQFPLMVADDLFLDSLFDASEKRTVPDVVITVGTPLRTADLVRRLVRVRRGNAAMRRASATGEVGAAVRPAARGEWFTAVVVPHPWLLPAGVVYAGLTAYAALRAKLDRHSSDWGRDESTRT